MQENSPDSPNMTQVMHSQVMRTGLKAVTTFKMDLNIGMSQKVPLGQLLLHPPFTWAETPEKTQAFTEDSDAQGSCRNPLHLI